MSVTFDGIPLPLDTTATTNDGGVIEVTIAAGLPLYPATRTVRTTHPPIPSRLRRARPAVHKREYAGGNQRRFLQRDRRAAHALSHRAHHPRRHYYSRHLRKCRRVQQAHPGRSVTLSCLDATCWTNVHAVMQSGASAPMPIRPRASLPRYAGLSRVQKVNSHLLHPHSL